MPFFNRHGSHIDRSTGRNKRDKITQGNHPAAPKRRSDGSGEIESRAASARKMRIERQQRRDRRK